MKKGFVESPSLVTEDELKLINKFTKRSLNADEVYTFSVVLCDNEIDRDFERFTPDALYKLAELYIGKTGIFDHSMKGKDQIARIYSCEVEKTGETTTYGEDYMRLKAKAYLPRTSKNEDFILKLDAGIMKEVSVGCAVADNICSVCGNDVRSHRCEHRKGVVYGDNPKTQCHVILDNPTDAYEWSFVAVPAQKRAGVVKAFDPKKGEKQMSAKEIIKSFSGDEDITFSAEQAIELKREISHMEEVCKDYLDELKRETVKNCATALPALCGEYLDGMLDRISLTQLKAFCAALKTKSAAKPQLGKASAEVGCDNSTFKI